MVPQTNRRPFVHAAQLFAIALLHRAESGLLRLLRSALRGRQGHRLRGQAMSGGRTRADESLVGHLATTRWWPYKSPNNYRNSYHRPWLTMVNLVANQLSHLRAPLCRHLVAL